VNPTGTLVHTGQGRDVEMVIVDGRIVVEGGELVLAKSASIVADAKRAAQALWTRAAA
jgi:5-methylthioadenosine/S-adenosylhomocysteine deaminase